MPFAERLLLRSPARKRNVAKPPKQDEGPISKYVGYPTVFPTRAKWVHLAPETALVMSGKRVRKSDVRNTSPGNLTDGAGRSGLIRGSAALGRELGVYVSFGHLHRVAGAQLSQCRD